jgi:hypothetical protein
MRNLVPNLRRYPGWLLQTHSPFILLALLAPLFGPRAGSDDARPRARFSWLALAFAACVFLCYAFYIPFDHWSYLRFLLPALPLLVLLSAGALVSLCRRRPGWGELATTCCVALVALLCVQAAVRGDVFDLRSAFRDRFREVGQFVNDRSSRNAAFIGLVQTSNVAYYGHRQTVRYDLIPPAEFDRAVQQLRHAGYEPYLLLMAEEEPDFRARFTGKSRVGELRCAPRSTFAGGAVRLYDVGDCETETGQ